MVFQWLGQDIDNESEKRSGFSQKADAEGFAVVYPNGEWCYEDQLHTDFEFIRRILEDVAKSIVVDRKRIYLVGVYDGGAFAYLVAAEMSQEIAALAVIDGWIGKRTDNGEITMMPRDCSAMSVMIFHRENNSLVPIKGNGYRCLSAEDAVSFWRKVNKPRTYRRKICQSNKFIHEIWSEGKSGTEISFYTLLDDFSIWRTEPDSSLGPSTDQPHISATNLIWRFFRNHPKKW
jgi:polyhydroxybutyrate depolymerase